MRTDYIQHANREHGITRCEQVKNEASELMRSCVREIEVLGGGTVKGAWNSAQKRWKHDPAGVIMEAGTSVGTGIAMACAAEAAPVIAVGIGAIAGLNFVWSSINPSVHAARNSELLHAWNSTWHSDDKRKMNYYANKVAHAVGPEAFDFALCTAFGTGGFCASEMKMAATSARVLNGGFHRLPTHKISGFDHAQRMQISGNETTAMRHFIDGDSHAFDRNHLSLRAERQIRYENATRRPLQTRHSSMTEYTSAATPRMQGHAERLLHF